MTRPPRSEYATGVIFGAAAYAMWGVFPLFWPLLEPAGALEILAHRICWSLLFLLLILTVRRGWPSLRVQLRRRRSMGLLAIASVLVAFNWGMYIWAVNASHVVETSLGYFINPLVSVLLGVVVLRERLRPMQWSAFAIASLAVLVLTAGYGRLPWIALALAFSFGSYGLVKKLADVPAVESLTVETSLLAPVALVFLIVMEATGRAAFGHVSAANTALLATTGVVTALPLLAFGGAVIRVPLTTIGLLQYIAPVLQFAIGVFVFGEPMPPARWVGFIIVWVALIIFTIDALRHGRSSPPSTVDELEVAEPV